MKLKLSEIVSAESVFKNISKWTFSARLSYIISRNIKNIGIEFAEVEKARMELFKKLGIETSEGKYQIMSDNIEEYTKEINSLLQQEVEVDIIQIGIDEFDYRLSPDEMGLISWMFKFEE